MPVEELRFFFYQRTRDRGSTLPCCQATYSRVADADDGQFLYHAPIKRERPGYVGIVNARTAEESGCAFFPTAKDRHGYR
jgi:hypothetical protein